MKSNKILMLLICILIIALTFVSCKNGEQSGTDLADETSLFESATDSVSDENSIVSDENVETSEQSSTEDESPETSGEVSEEHSSESTVSSEDDLTGNKSWDEILEEYKDLESIKAIMAMGEKYKESIHLNMKGRLEVSGYLFEMTVDTYGEEKSGNSLSIANFSGMGQTIMSQKELVLDGVKYGIDDTNKIYCVIPEEETDSFIGFENVEKVVTKNEIVKGEIYTTDWFIAKDGSRLGIYTKKSEIKYMSITMDMGSGEKMEMLFDITFEEMEDGIKFEVPEGYALVDYEGFQGGANV